MKIIKLSPAERKIGLSIRALKSDEFRTDWETYQESTGTGEATLGDHIRYRELAGRSGRVVGSQDSACDLILMPAYLSPRSR